MPDSNSAPPLIFWPAMAAGLAFWSLVITLAILFFRRRRAGKGSACGQCGYDVRGLPTFTCPECGSDLRQVGIRSGAASGNPLLLLARAIASSWKRLVLWTVAYIIVMAGVMYGAITFVLQHDVFPHSQAILEPTSKGYRVIIDQTGDMRHVSGSAAGHNDKLRGKSLTIQLSAANAPADHNTDFHVDLNNWSYQIVHWVGGTSPNLPWVNFKRGDLEKFFKEKQIDATTAGVQAEIDSLMLLIDATREMPVHRAANSAKNFSVVSAADKSEVQMNTSIGPPGMFFIVFGGSFWLLPMSGIIIARLIKLSSRGDDSPAVIQPAPLPRSADGLANVARTVTILFSDIKDYTARSAAASRSGAVELVRRHRDLSAPIIRQRRGNLVKTIGDALLVTFDSATDAVLAGLEIQAAAAMQNAGDANGQALQLRIAIATGEVIVEAGDVYGETVNLASRLQQIAKPGEVIVSAATSSLVNGREVQLDSYGQHQLAGFKSPVQAFVAKSITPAGAPSGVPL